MDNTTKRLMDLGQNVAESVDRERAKRAAKDRREYIAAMAMQGLLANPNYDMDPVEYADWAIRRADALIKQLDND